MRKELTSNQLDQIDTCTKCLTQSKAHINSLMCEDNVKYINPKDVGAVLWAVSDRLDELTTAFRTLSN